MRAYKTVNDTYIEPISFTVPRRAETFQSDIFPPATGLKPAVSAKEWLEGKDGIPNKIDLESVYEGTAPKEVVADYKPPTIASAPTPAAKPAPKPAPAPAPEPAPVSRSPPPSMKDQGASMANMASKFKDDEPAEPEVEDDNSSFEEVQRPAQRAAPAAATPARVEHATKIPSPIKPASPAFKSPASTSQPSPIKQAAPSPSSSGHIESSLDQIRQMLEQQTKLIGKQNDKISQLSAEVEGLKRKVNAGGSQDQSERIRQLELELEAARS